MSCPLAARGGIAPNTVKLTFFVIARNEAIAGSAFHVVLPIGLS